jgi:hypothetical protein
MKTRPSENRRRTPQGRKPKSVRPEAPTSARKPLHAEAPDRGIRETEAPETQAIHRAEAPDAGEALLHSHLLDF